MSSEVLNSVNWTESYRPTSLDEVALEPAQRRLIEGYIEAGEIPHLFLVGPPGSGKTTVAKIINDAIDCRVLTLNASAERGIDVVREKVGSFAQSMFTSSWNHVFLDEADALTADAQTALRNTMETFAEKTRFILTANNGHKVIGPLQSRCQVIPLGRPPLVERCRVLARILKAEGIAATKQIIVGYAERYPDMRQMLLAAQQAYLAADKRDDGLPPVPPRGSQDGATLFEWLVKGAWPSFKSVTTRADFNAGDVLRELFWAVPDNHPKAFFLRGIIGKGVHESGFTPDPVVLFLAVVAECMDGVSGG